MKQQTEDVATLPIVHADRRSIFPSTRLLSKIRIPIKSGYGATLRFTRMPRTVSALSKLVLGGERRLQIAAAVGASTDGSVTTADIVKETGFTSTEVSKELGHFYRADLLLKAGHGRYQRNHDAFWAGCAVVFDAARAEQGH